VPTSLLAMVDSSVGGKTGINLPQGKNLVGAFHQPSLVLADINTLKTLPRREYVSGLSEVVKYGVIRDADFFQWLEKRCDALKEPGNVEVEEMVARCCAIKAEVVGLDERESGLRAILNFGHTMGHAIEKVGGYGAWLHGEAVAMGMVYALRLSQEVRGLAAAEADRVVALMKNLGLPVKMPKYDWTELRKAMAVDKKSTSSIPRFVLAERIGTVVVGCEISEEKLKAVWNELKS
jgi:3-dehydroquinate synthetase